ncbi:hypothetical protein [Methylovulum miyakonense]|uniref:hypothetical protein n=1 Tax=Methylovulum miyakonense TaxID=645578 RepID=UPI00037CB009|nr:hypothetical protein [Methylovulum miyakonense]
MKTLVSAIFVNSGIAKASQKPYSMARAVVLNPFQPTDTANFQCHGVGLSAVELSVSDGFITAFQNQFNADFKGQPVLYDIDTVLDREGRNIIVGFATSPVPVSAPVDAAPAADAAKPVFGNK